jgi:subtilisin family serine protease
MQPHANYIMLPLEPNCEIDGEVSDHDGTEPDDGWSVISGTSAAAPQLAGVCALLKQKNPGLSPAEVKAVLNRTARDVTEGQANKTSNPVRVDNRVELVPIKAGIGPDGATGHGLVDAFAAWQQV